MIDSHTGGEPTRVIVDGAPDLGNGSVAEKLKVLKNNFDWLRTATVCEPRGSEVWVGAVLCPPSDPSCVAGAIFYNSVGYLGMCGHGSIGVVKTLAHLGRIKVGTQRLETPVGIVSTTLHADGSVSITNVPSYRKEKSVRLESAAMGDIAGDIAWGGNWFYLIEADQLALSLEHEPKLREITWQIMRDINSQGFPEVDHIELFGPPLNRLANSRNFVLCPGGAYDRSPCGTGTSAKLACLAADGKLDEGEEWVQESFIGSCFSGRYKWLDKAHGIIEPTIRGTAYVTAESTLVVDPADPFCYGLLPTDSLTQLASADC